jgi:hypothetical protein
MDNPSADGPDATAEAALADGAREDEESDGFCAALAAGLAGEATGLAEETEEDA